MTFAGTVGRFQKDHYNADTSKTTTSLKAIVTNHNLGYRRGGGTIDFLGYFETTWNKNIEPGEYYWPYDPDTPSEIIKPIPQRSYQIFETYLDETLLEEMTQGISGSTNITTATIVDAITIDNPAYGITAGMKVSVLYIPLNAYTPRTG